MMTDYTITIKLRLKGGDPLLTDDWIYKSIEEQFEGGEFIDQYEVEAEKVCNPIYK